ncbi:MFS transporter [Mastigocoleus sp. MO_188.B34]|uniref:MFS transporter n=1 Tax=Mastigocoleus sp. MO_188.B34 TaxID=3036635 RepID=UPI002618481B|nr:MFS transporter [Mastigocoleus sp. MO_188.B34]MDJ0693276.1 MFS transporter [Mastigocoleus sp. MO_188.B34]
MSYYASDSFIENDSEPESKINFGTKLAFGTGDLGTAITSMILISYLSPFLTDVAGLSPVLAGRTQLVGKIWDAVNDPMVGFASDRTQSKEGRRYPWMIWGAIPFGLFFFLQWIVPDLNQWGLFWYYTIISILFNAFYTIVNLPYTALTAELTEDYNERTSLNSFRFAFSISGSILALVIALILSGVFPNSSNQQYMFLGGICALLSIIPLYLCVWGTKKQAQRIARQNANLEKPVSLSFGEQIKIVLHNRPFLFVLGIYLCSWMAVQLTASIIPYFVSSWMRLEKIHITLVLLAVQGTAMVMLFFWSSISQRIGKKAVYFLGTIFWIIAQVGLFFLQPGQVGLMYALAVIAGLGISVAYLIPWSMLPDVIELDELRTGQRREGVFYSFVVFVQKICLGIAISVVLQRLGTAGYIKPTLDVPLPIQPDSVLEVIRVSIGPLPAIVLIAGLILAYFYPITREKHAQMLLELRERRIRKTNANV